MNPASNPPTDFRPVMTERELSWHETIAGMRARKEAEATGSPPDARHALVTSAAAEAGKLTVAGLTIPALTLGTLWAIEESEGRASVLTGHTRYADLALVSLTLLRPEETLLAFLGGDLAPVKAGMLEMASALSPDQALALDRWFSSEMTRLRNLTGDATAADEPGKSSAASSH
jgi:hypothetical protein